MEAASALQLLSDSPLASLLVAQAPEDAEAIEALDREGVGRELGRHRTQAAVVLHDGRALFVVLADAGAELFSERFSDGLVWVPGFGHDAT
jgi:hypothetical protein